MVLIDQLDKVYFTGEGRSANNVKHAEKRTPTNSLETILNEDAEFLAGKQCLYGGGAGWWKYEFCYGKRVSSFLLSFLCCFDIFYAETKKKVLPNYSLGSGQADTGKKGKRGGEGTGNILRETVEIGQFYELCIEY